MRKKKSKKSTCALWALALLLAGTSLSGCSADNSGYIVAGGLLGLTAFGAHSPAQEIEQVYYLGVADPQGAVPPSIYRLTVHGQASAISLMSFGSGWVPSRFIDSLDDDSWEHLGTPMPDDKDDEDDKGDKGNGESIKLNTGRTYVHIGPEGTREVPKKHRLVIVMGSDPSAYFKAVDMVAGMAKSFQNEATAKDHIAQKNTSAIKEREDLDTFLSSLKETPSDDSQEGATE